jgi:hypothetical protein
VSAPDAPAFDEERIIRVLDQHGVEYVLIGGLGARLRGATRRTMDFDMCASWELANPGRLADALNALDAQLKVLRRRHRHSHGDPLGPLLGPAALRHPAH